eukprot:3937318-Rhodomonas_salina.1
MGRVVPAVAVASAAHPHVCQYLLVQAYPRFVSTRLRDTGCLAFEGLGSRVWGLGSRGPGSGSWGLRVQRVYSTWISLGLEAPSMPAIASVVNPFCVTNACTRHAG